MCFGFQWNIVEVHNFWEIVATAFPSMVVAGNTAVQNSDSSYLEAGTLESPGNSSETWAQCFVAVLAAVVHSFVVAVVGRVGDTKRRAKKQCLEQSAGR